MLIDCDTCRAPRTACDDCVMTVLLQLQPRPVELDGAEAEALGALAGAGLVPPLRLVVGVQAHDVRAGAAADCQLDRTVDDADAAPGRLARDSGGSGRDRDERSAGGAERPARGPGFRGIA